MKRRNDNTKLYDELMESVNGMKEAETDSFFYTRLTGKMQKQDNWVFPLKPSWIIAGLAFLLLLNGFMTIDKFKTNGQNEASSTSPLQNFANAYDLTIQSGY